MKVIKLPTNFYKTFRAWMISAAFFASSMGGAQATVIDWSGATNLLWATDTNWTGGVAPVNDTTTDIARFDLGAYAGTVSAVTRSVTGIQIGSGSGALTISSTNITLGADGVNMESGAAATTIGKITFGVDASVINNSSNTLNLSGANVFTGKVTFGGTGVITLGAAATGTGGVKIDGANFQTGSSNIFGTNALELKSGAFEVNGNRSHANALTISGDFTLRSGGNSATFTGTKTTTAANTVLTFQQSLSSSSSGGNNLNFTTNALVLGGNLEVKIIGGGTAGTYGLKVNLGDIDTGAADRSITLSHTAGTLTFGKLILSNNLTFDGASTLVTTLSGGLDTGGVNRTLTFNNSGSGIPTLSGALTGTASTVTLAGTSTNARIGALTGATAHAFEVNNSGTVTFNGASTFTGGVTVTNGVAVVSTTAGVAGTSGPLGTGALVINGGRLESTFASGLLGSSVVTVNGGELRAIGANTLVTNAIPITLNGGTLRGFNAATINYGGGAINVTDDSTIVNERSGPSSGTSMNLTFGTSVAVGNAQLNVTSTDNQTGGTSTVTLGAGTLTGNGILNVTKNSGETNNTVLALTSLGVTGAGNQIAAGNGTVSVSGATTVDGTGTLLVNGNLTANSGVSVATGGTLGGSGVITGAVVIDGNLAPGNSPGLLSTGALTLNSGANSTFQIDGLTRGTQYDAVNVTGLLTMGGILTLDFGFVPDVADTFDLFNFTTQTGSFSSIVFVDSGYAGTFDASTGILSLTTIPEPSTYAMLVGGLGLLAFLRRRKA